MTCAWGGTVGQFKSLINTGKLFTEIYRGFEVAFWKPTETEMNSWNISLPELSDVLSDPKFDTLQIILELNMPIGGERADVILLGGSDKNPLGMIIELKQWSNINLDTDTFEVDVPGLGFQQHPSLQVLNYRGKLKFYNSRAHNYRKLTAIVYMHNISRNDKAILEANIPNLWVKEAPIYSSEQKKELSDFISISLLPCTLLGKEHVIFSQAPYAQSNQLFSFLETHASDIAKNAALAIANVGMGLTTEQDLLLNDVFSALKAGKKRDFIVQGGPGSGKTLLAVSILLKAAEKKYTTALALRNNRLQAILRQIFDNAYSGVSGMMMYFEPPHGMGGIAQFNGKLDLLICDEAQRMESRIMPNVLSKSKVSIIFLDETQRLNPPEQGTVQNFVNASSAQGRTPIPRTLTASLRVPIGYSRWIEHLLSEPENIINLKIQNELWKDTYKLISVDSINVLLEQLAKYKSPNDRVALVASFTESPGNSSVSHPDNLRIGYPLTSGFSLYKNSNINMYLFSVDIR